MHAVEQRPWVMHLRGIAAAFEIAVRRLAWSKFMLSNIILCIIPVAISLLIVIVGDKPVTTGMHEIHKVYEGFLRTIYIHLIVFFIANVFGFAVVRQEVEDHTLHYLLLQPARRWSIFVGRFLAYLAIVSVFCVGSLWLTYLILSLPTQGFSPVVADLFGKGRFVILCKESAVLVLGLAAYGAIAMLAGTFFKSGLYAIFLLVWEWALPYIPQALKEWTVLHYLHSLLPERPQDMDRMFEILGDPSPAWMSIGVALLVTAVALGVATALFQFKECQYADS